HAPRSRAPPAPLPRPAPPPLSRASQAPLSRASQASRSRASPAFLSKASKVSLRRFQASMRRPQALPTLSPVSLGSLSQLQQTQGSVPPALMNQRVQVPRLPQPLVMQPQTPSDIAVIYLLLGLLLCLLLVCLAGRQRLCPCCATHPAGRQRLCLCLAIHPVSRPRLCPCLATHTASQ